MAIIDQQKAVTYSLDLNKTIRHRDYYIIQGIAGTNIIEDSGVVLAEYAEGLVTMTGGTGSTGTFPFTFTSSPIIVLTPENASFWGENVIVYGLTAGLSSFTFETSAPYSGTILYRAIYSPTYPAYATSSFTASITASAGEAHVDTLHYYTASFTALPVNPTRFVQTAWNFEPTNLVNVYFETQTTSSTQATVEISAPFSRSIHFIAFS